VRIKFVDEHGMEEAGIDGGGLFKDFMEHLVREVRVHLPEPYTAEWMHHSLPYTCIPARAIFLVRLFCDAVIMLPQTL